MQFSLLLLWPDWPTADVPFILGKALGLLLRSSWMTSDSRLYPTSYWTLLFPTCSPFSPGRGGMRNTEGNVHHTWGSRSYVSSWPVFLSFSHSLPIFLCLSSHEIEAWLPLSVTIPLRRKGLSQPAWLFLS